MKEITCKTILLSWLKEHPGMVVAHHHIDLMLPKYGLDKFQTMYSSATYHRNFCWLKNEPETLRQHKIELEPLVEGSGKVNEWKIVNIFSDLVLALN